MGNGQFDDAKNEGIAYFDVVAGYHGQESSKPNQLDSNLIIIQSDHGEIQQWLNILEKWFIFGLFGCLWW